jgi:tetratricopeptide (TPR) repeat protein
MIAGMNESGLACGTRVTGRGARPGPADTASPDEAASQRAAVSLALSASALWQKGARAEAKAQWLKALALRPDHAESWRGLGLALLAEGNAALAAAALQEAARLLPHEARLFLELGYALASLGADQEAEAAFRRAHLVAGERERATAGEAAFGLGLIAARSGRWGEAASSFRQAATLRPPWPEAWVEAAHAHLAAGEAKAALAAFEEARAALGEDETGLRLRIAQGRGAAWHLLGETAQARAAFEEVLHLKPEDGEALSNLCALAQDAGDLDAALAFGRRAIAAAPRAAPAWSNLGNALLTMGAFAEAEAAYRAALRLDPRFTAALVNLGAALRDQGRLEEAELACRAALLLAPEHAGAHYNLALVLLTAGRYREGWAEHEWRWRTGQMPPPRIDAPRWQGEPFPGRRLLLHAEQGFGDTIQFIRYAPLAAARGGEVVVLAPAPLKRLLATVPGVARVFSPGEALPHVDVHCPLMSLPFVFETTLETIPRAVPYFTLPPPPPRPAGPPRIGLVWAGAPRPEEPRAYYADRRRSLPLRAFAGLAAFAGRARFVSLQLGRAAGESPPEGLVLERPLEEGDDFLTTAEVMQGLDLVISVDTAPAHLAAALGRPVWLLSRFDGCWRWLRAGAESPWYPTLRLYRQPAPGAWAPVLEALCRDLAAWLGERACTGGKGWAREGQA